MGKSERDHIARLHAHATETRTLWSNEKKPERERMVVRAFLRCMGIGFAENDIISEERDPPDVVFRDARFEVMEDLGGRKRGDEWREREERRRDATQLSDISEPYAASEPMSMTEVWERVVEGLTGKATSYGPALCSQLDALVYLNLNGRHLQPPDEAPMNATREKGQAQGWRSVSLVFPPYGATLWAGQSAPSFLTEAAQRGAVKWPHFPDEQLFDP
jgi:hypothetical protein